MIETSMISPAAWIKAMLPALRHSQGRLLYTSSSAVKTALPAWGAFTSIRGGMHHLLASLAKEEAKVTCMAVEPGVMQTETLKRVLGRVKQEMPAGHAKWFESVKALDPSEPAEAFVNLILAAPSSRSGTFSAWNEPWIAQLSE